MALIVTSILIAFALNAWWEGLRENRQETRYLTAVRRELIGNQAALEDDLATTNRGDAAVAELVAHMGPGADGLPLDSLAALFDYSFQVGVLELPMGTIQGLLASGGLSVISDDELKSRLAAWPAQVAQARNDTELVVQNREELIAFLDDLMPTLYIARHTGVLDHYRASRFPVATAPVLSNRRIEGLLGNRGIRMYNVRRDFTSLKAKADTMIVLIDARLDR